MNQKQLTATIEQKTATIKPCQIRFNSGLQHFSTVNGTNIKIDENIVNSFDFTVYEGKLKTVVKDLRPKIIFYYLKSITKDGSFIKPSNDKIGSFFGVKRQMISEIISNLRENKYIRPLTDIEKETMYKLLKEEYENV